MRQNDNIDCEAKCAGARVALLHPHVASRSLHGNDGPWHIGRPHFTRRVGSTDTAQQLRIGDI